MDANQIVEALQAPFPPEDIEWRVGSTNKDKTKGLALAYITNRAIQNRLDEVFGPFGWQNQFKEWKQGSQLCGISVKFGDEWITKWDGADDSNQEATKGGLSDSMKRAAYQWGIGRYLYKLPQNWVAIEPIGRSYKIKKKPSLPSWAIPKGCKQEENAVHDNEQHIPPENAQSRENKATEEQKKTTGMASKNQRNAIFAISKNKGLDNEQMKQLIQYLNNKQSTSELTSKEASDMIKLLQETERDELLAMISNSSGPDFGKSIDISDEDLPF